MPSNLAEFAADYAYPKIEVQKKDRALARLMLSNIGDDDSEASSVALYLYGSVVTATTDPEISKAFRDVLAVERTHLEVFCNLAYRFGADPRLWRPVQQSVGGEKMVYWSPSRLHYATEVQTILENAIALERAQIKKYEKEIAAISEDSLILLLRRIILDEQMHIEMFRGLLK
ncbi:MAG: rubrerythrin family protein [Oscillospiraceae bacterium]|jgi:bacterioferritin|nr:rubrerythrin family protein [Oscillospiraceae bacterium]